MKASFFYAIGTSYILNIMTPGFGSIVSLDNDQILRFGNSIINPRELAHSSIRGLNGETFMWDMTPISDPFRLMLDPELWDQREMVEYPAVVFPGSISIGYGRSSLMAKIMSLPRGKKFAIGGYSQGAAVCSTVYEAGLKPGTGGPLESRRDDFLGAVCFGNPRRQVNHRGASGAFGTWSGSWIDHTITSGSGGAFPDGGPLGRLTGCEQKWVEFTAPRELASAIGNSEADELLRFAGGIFLGTPDVFSFLKNVLKDGVVDVMQAVNDLVAGKNGQLPNYFIDANGNPRDVGGAGHTTYSIFPPPNSGGVHPTTTTVIGDKTYHTAVGQTAYQLGAQWLNDQAELYVDDPVIAPPPPVVNYGWSTTLSPPV